MKALERETLAGIGGGLSPAQIDYLHRNDKIVIGDPTHPGPTVPNPPIANPR